MVYVLFLFRLRDLSKIEISDLHKNTALQSELRYHAIDWDAKNIPIGRHELDWVDKNIINNEDEFVFYQFHISKALGRVMGYWQENVFFIVLVDPLHNIQPSKFSNYKIRPCYPVNTDLTNYIYHIEKVREIDCIDKECKVKSALLKINPIPKEINAVICFLDTDFLEKLYKIIETKTTLTQILEMGILTLELK